MSESTETKKSGSTDLTWEEQNPFSYRFDVEVLTKLQEAVEKVRNGESGWAEVVKHEESLTAGKD